MTDPHHRHVLLQRSGQRLRRGGWFFRSRRRGRPPFRTASLDRLRSAALSTAPSGTTIQHRRRNHPGHGYLVGKPPSTLTNNTSATRSPTAALAVAHRASTSTVPQSHHQATSGTFTVLGVEHAELAGNHSHWRRSTPAPPRALTVNPDAARERPTPSVGRDDSVTPTNSRRSPPRASTTQHQRLDALLGSYSRQPPAARSPTPLSSRPSSMPLRAPMEPRA